MQVFNEFTSSFFFCSIFGEYHQEVTACSNANRFAFEFREGCNFNREFSGFFEVSTFTDGGANHTQFAGQVSLEAFFVGSVQAAAIFNHISHQLESFCSFRSIETSLNFTVNFFQHYAAIGFNDSLLSPVVSIFLHEEAHVAGFVFNGFCIRFNFSPGFRSFFQASSCEDFRVVVQNGYGNGVRQANLFAIFGLSQFQYVGQEVVLQEFRVASFSERVIQIYGLEVFSSVVQERITHLNNVRVFTGSNSSLQVLGQAFVHIRVVFFYNFDARVFSVKVFYQFFNGSAAEAFSSYVPIFDLYFFASVSLFLFAATATYDCAGCKQGNHSSS